MAHEHEAVGVVVVGHGRTASTLLGAAEGELGARGDEQRVAEDGGEIFRGGGLVVAAVGHLEADARGDVGHQRQGAHLRGLFFAAAGLAVAPWLAATPAGQAAWLTAALIPALVALLFLNNGGIVPLAEAALAQLLTGPNGLDATRYGRVRMWGSIGFIVAVLAGGALLQPLGIGVFPWLVVGINATLLVVAIRLPTGHEERHAGEPAPPVMPLLRQPAVAWFFGSVFFTVLAHTSLYAFLSLYLVHSGYGKQAVGALWAVSVAVEVLFFLLQGHWFHRLSPHGWLALAAGITALRFAAMAAAGAQPWVLVLAQLTHAITFAGHHAACIALVSRHFPGRLRGRGQALYSALGYGLSGLLGGVGGGWLIDRAGFGALYAAATAAGLLALGCVGLAWRADPSAHPAAQRPVSG